MARKLRIQFEGALYHVINRGNYQRDVFETVGAAEFFLAALFEGLGRFGWCLHAYVLMRNHFLLALETPKCNLVGGMHGLQNAVATRFKCFWRERGHLFQGRYQAIVLEDLWVMGRVVDYIHLNPVRAKVVLPEQVGWYRSSSLTRFLKGPRPCGLVSDDWLKARKSGWCDDARGWNAYQRHLIELARDEAEQKRQGLEGLSRGWALGTSGWRRTLAGEHAHLRLDPGLEREHVRDLQEASWRRELADRLGVLGRKYEDLHTRPMSVPWKLLLAQSMRRETDVSLVWLARHLRFGKAASLRSYLSRFEKQKDQ